MNMRYKILETIDKKLQSGEFMIITRKEYDGLRAAVKNFQKAKKK